MVAIKKLDKDGKVKIMKMCRKCAFDNVTGRDI
jgi:hypothetical protein